MKEKSALLVTGGTGFLGQEVVRRAVADGREVHVLQRSTTRPGGPADPAVNAHGADLEDESGLRRAFEAVAGVARRQGLPLDVVHLAACISYRRADRRLLERVNVEGTRRVLAASAEVGVRRICHVSSVVALGAVPSPRDELDDDAPLGGLLLASAYARTKAQAEELALAASGTLDLVVASPAVVFGVSGANSNSLHFLRRVLGGRLGLVSPPGSLSVVGLSDTVEGILLVLERGTRGHRYLLSESAWELKDLLALACEHAGRARPWGRVPRPAWKALVSAAALVDVLAPRERVTPEALAMLGLHFRFRARRARAELGWRPTPFRDVMAELVTRLVS